MIPGMNPRDVQKAMKRLGIKQEEIDAVEVIIRTADKEIIIADPQVSKINMGGQETFQISGTADERALSSEPDINEEDIQTVMAQTGADEQKVKEVLIENEGDLAKTIMDLKQ
jgi:nascent polypeptide-associated complex subunit alpha